MDTQFVLIIALVVAIVVPAWLLLIFQWTGIVVSRATLNDQIERTREWKELANHSQKVSAASADTLDEIATEFQKTLKETLYVHFSLSELRNLCFDLEIEWDDLEGTTKNEKIISIIDYVLRHNEIGKLNNYLRTNRRDIWLGRRGSNVT